jgi:hypothetical protein
MQKEERPSEEGSEVSVGRVKRRKAPLRTTAKQRLTPETPLPRSVWVEAWLRYRDFYDSFMVHPSEFAQGGEGEGSVGMAIIRIPALVVYFPIYFIFLLVLLPIFYPFMLIASMQGRK